MNNNDQARFNLLYSEHTSSLLLQGKSDKTIEMYSQSIRRLSQFFDVCPDNLSTEQLKQYFLALVESHSWSTVKVDRNAIQFFYQYVLHKDWEWVNIIKPPKIQPLQDVLAIQEVGDIINATCKLSYQTFFLVAYSMGLRLSEALHLEIADIAYRDVGKAREQERKL